MTNSKTTFFMPRAPWHLAPAPVKPVTPAKPATAPKVTPPGKGVIHISDLIDFCRCRRSWNWSSQLRRGLQPSVTPVPLFFGQAIHEAMKHGYRDCVGEDHASFSLAKASGAFHEWMDHHIQQTIKYTGPLWSDEKVGIQETRDLGAMMLRHYALWVKPLDPMFRLLDLEKMFRVRLPGVNGLEYGGRFDGIVQDRDSGNVYILEFKTTKSLSDARISGVLRSMQPAAYAWASEFVYGQRANGVLYRFLLKREPDNPRMLQDGTYSKAKSIKSTHTWITYVLGKLAEGRYDAYCDEQGEYFMPLNTRPLPKDVRDSEFDRGMHLLHMLRQRDETDESTGVVIRNDFFYQKAMSKKPRQVEDAVTAIVEEGKRMVDPNTRVYPVSGFHCNWCSFKSVCDLVARGLDEQAEAVLDASYGPRTYWEPEIVEEY